MTQSPNPAPLSSGASVSSARRDTASAQTPLGTSSTKPVSDQMTNSELISATDSPASANNSA